MLTRTAIVLSLGMLLEKVETSGFIVGLLQRAAKENKEFQFTKELEGKAFLLAEKFNKNEIEPKEFSSQLLKLLGIQNMDASEFWLEWNKIVTVGNIADKIRQLQNVAYEHDALLYLSSDTNIVHLKKIKNESAEQGINLKNDGSPMLLEYFPLYASCQIGKNRQELLKYLVNDMRSKEYNRPDEVILILGNPENIKDKNHQQMARKECDAITNWCDGNKVSVQLHNNSLEETFMQIFSLENAVDKKCSMGY